MVRPIRQIPKHELVATTLLDGLRDGRWSGTLPGVLRLAADLYVSPNTVRQALRQLEADGLLGGRGPGRSRGVIADSAALDPSPRKLRVAILRHDKRLIDNPQISLILVEIVHSLEAAGHAVFFCTKNQLDLKHDVRRTSRQLLEWCSNQTTPCLALYGKIGDLPLAYSGPDMMQAHRDAVRHLLALGHRRIVLIVSETHRKPVLGKCEIAFLEELRAHGLVTGSYNLPEWEETPQGLDALLKKLFQRTPPTALVIDETPRFLATMAFLARHGIRVPEHVSLVSTDCDATFDWCHPPMAHLHWDSAPIIRRVVNWAKAVKNETADRRSINQLGTFVPGGSTGPVRKG